MATPEVETVPTQKDTSDRLADLIKVKDREWYEKGGHNNFTPNPDLPDAYNLHFLFTLSRCGQYQNRNDKGSDYTEVFKLVLGDVLARKEYLWLIKDLCQVVNPSDIEKTRLKDLGIDNLGEYSDMTVPEIADAVVASHHYSGDYVNAWKISRQMASNQSISYQVESRWRGKTDINPNYWNEKEITCFLDLINKTKFYQLDEADIKELFETYDKTTLWDEKYFEKESQSDVLYKLVTLALEEYVVLGHNPAIAELEQLEAAKEAQYPELLQMLEKTRKKFFS